MVADMEVHMLAAKEVDQVADNVAAKNISDIEWDIVADMKVDKVADMVAKVFKNKCITPEMF